MKQTGIMTAKEKDEAISKWLGYIWDESFSMTIDGEKSDFLNNRNQQKLIEDKLIKDGYRIKYEYPKGCDKNMIEEWLVVIYSKNNIDAVIFNKSKDTAFIDAVIELIKSK